MADRGDTHYHVRQLNVWFALSSLVLLVSAFWMVIDDWSREWKQYQTEFRRIEIRRAEEALAEQSAQAAIAEEGQLAEQYEQAEARLAQRSGEIQAAEDELIHLEAEQFKAVEAEKKAKQNYNWERFLVDEFRAHHGEDDEGYAEKLANLKTFEDEMARLGNEKKGWDARVADQHSKLKSLYAELDEIESEMKRATKDIDLVRTKLASIAPEDKPTQIANIIRDFPGLDFIGPSLKVNKVMPPDLTFELNFTRKPRIDMCQTCHLAVDREGFEDEEQPFKTHPDLDLYLTAKSPHPLSSFGCTICHRGAGEALNFQHADHRASTFEEGEEWYDKYHWHKQHYWDYPMLKSNYIEASCVQCHKDSIELIQPEAPKVTEGYELFERYGCYSCHKVEWFPTKRRPGPSLAAIQHKTTKPFVDQWIKDPKEFRPTTWMPQIFHLENYGPDVTVVNSNYGQGRAMMGPEWSDAAVAAVAAFIWGQSRTDDAPPSIPDGDPDRGAELFRLTGCAACHNTAPFDGEMPEEYADDEEFDGTILDLVKRPRGTNEHGPNLRGVATKLSPEWLFQWIKDPAAYWSETRMPDLRLPDQDIADIVAYVFDDPVFADAPEEWEPGEVSYERDVLEEQARWFFNRVLPEELERRFREEWADDRVLLRELGEKWVLNQGCHSCHEINGLEDAQPIGTELTAWASKTIDKLDFGFLPEILAEEHGWDYRQKTEFKEYRENFLENKLRNPRIYDRRKVKNPTERLKMPWFDFTEEEIEAITCFVAGLVDDEVQNARMEPSPEKLAMNDGLRAIRQKNCAGCHVIEPALIEFADEDGTLHRVRGSFLPPDEEFDPLPPPARGDFQAWLSSYEEAYEEEIPEVLIRLERPAPGFGSVGGPPIIVEDTRSVRVVEPAWGGDLVPVITDFYLWEDDVEDVDGERREYGSEAYDKLRWTFAPPVLIDEGAKLQSEWFYSFLLDPVPLREQIRVKMPTFHYAEGEAAAIADYFANRAYFDWPSRYANRLMVAQGETSETLADSMSEAGFKGNAQSVAGIAEGDDIAIATGLDELLAYGDELGFAIDARIDPAYEAIPQRTPAVLDPILESDPGFFDRVHRLTTDGGGPNCIQCHFLRGRAPTQDTPIAWAPDLDHARERLRPEWMRQWLIDPSKIYPGTSMPANFQLDSLQWQDYLAAPSEEQIEAVLLWLYNLDRSAPRN